MQTQQAIQTHGADAVYKAATKYMEGHTRALEAVGLNVEGMGGAWRVQSAAYRELSLMTVVEDQAEVAAKLATY